jgi:hypothetical protein
MRIVSPEARAVKDTGTLYLASKQLRGYLGRERAMLYKDVDIK